MSVIRCSNCNSTPIDLDYIDPIDELGWTMDGNDYICKECSIKSGYIKEETEVE